MCAACHCGPKYPAAASALSLAVPGGKASGGAGSWREGDGTRGLLATLQTLPAFHPWLSTLSHYSRAERDEMGDICIQREQAAVRDNQQSSSGC